ncbi:SDR family oxidoreductase [Spirochaeta dissipatitropha]
MKSLAFNDQEWAVILGGSSGFGLATAKRMSEAGLSVCVVHRDRKGAMARIEQEFAAIRNSLQGNARFLALNLDALSPEGLTTTINELKDAGAAGNVRVLLHSIAFGNLKPIAPVKKDRQEANAALLARLADELGSNSDAVQAALAKLLDEGHDAVSALVPPVYGDNLIEKEDMDRTIYSMGTSLLTWVQALHADGMFAADARVFGMTSEGNDIAWRGYAAVSAAKTALEAVSRSIAVEFAPYGIRSNIIQAGVTDTPALKLIPGSGAMKAAARQRNPFGRLTTPEDVANVITLLSMPEAGWVNGSLIRVDGGEHIASA